MNSVGQTVSRARKGVFAFLAAMTLSACIEEQPTAPRSPLLPPEPPDNPQILSASWRMDVNRVKRTIKITPPAGQQIDKLQKQIIADYFGVAPGSPDLSILAGDVIEIVTPGTLTSSAVGAFIPGQVRTTFNVAIRNKLSAVNIITPTFPAPPAGTSGVILFPFQITVTETPGQTTTGGDGTEVLVELPNRGLVAPSVDWDVAPFNFFNDTGCGPGSTDCYRSETFLSLTGTPVVQGGATSQSRVIGFDHDPTVSQFRVRMILAGDLQDATPNTPPTANANGPYAGNIGSPITLSSAGSTDPDGTISAYAWDLDNDGAFDDAAVANPSYTCTAPTGAKTIHLRVTDNRGATATATATVNCAAPANQAPVASAGGPYSGTIGGPAITVTGAASTDDGGITAYAWDLDNDGAFDDATGVTASFTCTAPAGAKTIRIQVTDNGTPALTGIASGTVNCAAAAPTTLRGRWVNASGAPITTATIGSTVFLELDLQLAAGENIHDFQGTLQFSSALASAPNGGADLNCSNPGGQASCPSGAPAAGNNDVMNQFTGSNSTPGQVGFLNFSVNADPNAGTGIQGLGRLQFTVNAAGTLTPTLSIQIAVNGAGTDLSPVISLLSLTIN